MKKVRSNHLVVTVTDTTQREGGRGRGREGGREGGKEGGRERGERSKMFWGIFLGPPPLLSLFTSLGR